MEQIIIQLDNTSKYPLLKKQLKGSDNFTNNGPGVWTKENIGDGLKKFFDDNGRYPLAEEIDDYLFLPSSRQIQRAFGGLKKLRADLGLPITDFGSGESRSKIAFEVGKRGIKIEREMATILTDYFGKYFVHLEAPLYEYFPENAKFKAKLRADFLIYHKNGIFGVDVFFNKNKKQINKNINVKREKYRGVGIPTYFVAVSEKGEITSQLIKNLINNKILKLDKNITVLTKSGFLNEIEKYRPLHAN